MTAKLQGKGMYIWIAERCEGGDMAEVARQSALAGMTHLTIKIAGGVYEYSKNLPYLQSLIEACHQQGIKVIGWHFVYGEQPMYEAQAAIKALRRYPYDGFIINAEGAYKNRASQAEVYSKMIRASFPDLLLALSSYRFPTLHREFPFNSFLKYVDLNMPQVYWMFGNGTVPGQLRRCVAEFASEKFVQRPIFPTGAAFTEHGWAAIPEDQKIFIEQARGLGLAGCNWWEYYHARHRLPDLWKAISQTPFGEIVPEPAPEPPAGEVKMRVEMLGNLVIRKTPEGVTTGEYALRGRTYEVYEISDENWYRIDGGWISGNTEWTKLIQTSEPTDPPVGELTVEQRLERLEKVVFG